MNQTIDFSQRDPATGVNEIFYQRWSPKAFKSRPVSNEMLKKIFDAARWAPSCYNEQPWLFITSTEKSREKFVSLLLEGNQSWAQTAPVIGFIVADRYFKHNGNENSYLAFDSGAAWMSMTLQARQLGLYTHGMGGVKFDEVYEALAIDKEQQQVLCAFALGELEDETNPGEKIKVSTRKPLSEIWREY